MEARSAKWIPLRAVKPLQLSGFPASDFTRSRDSRNRGMDIASSPWLNPVMRSGFLVLCGLLFLPFSLPGQEATSPVILNHPTGLTAPIGDTVTLTATVGGTPPLTFQWYKNNTVILGATNTSLTLPAVTLHDFGTYHVIVTNAHGTAQTAPALVYVVKKPQTIVLTPTTTTAI